DNPHRSLKNKGIIDSGCSRHMTGNKAYLADFQDFNGGHVAFGGSKGYITGKGKIKTAIWKNGYKETILGDLREGKEGERPHHTPITLILDLEIQLEEVEELLEEEMLVSSKGLEVEALMDAMEVYDGG
ncbi:hypothetical protein Tco_1063633, partial [Tanacetum coccineum]